jgi:hypothetical protein
MNGALAIADVLGIFGRERLDLASYYRFPGAQSPGFFAFKMYTNYDGKGGHFGDISMPTQSSDPENISAFGAKNSATGQIYVMIINKNPEKPYKTQVLFNGLAQRGDEELYRFDREDLTGIRQESLQFNGPLGLEIPAYSITLLVLKPVS